MFPLDSQRIPIVPYVKSLAIPQPKKSQRQNRGSSFSPDPTKKASLNGGAFTKLPSFEKLLAQKDELLRQSGAGKSLSERSVRPPTIQMLSMPLSLLTSSFASTAQAPHPSHQLEQNSGRNVARLMANQGDVRHNRIAVTEESPLR